MQETHLTGPFHTVWPRHLRLPASAAGAIARYRPFRVSGRTRPRSPRTCSAYRRIRPLRTCPTWVPRPRDAGPREADGGRPMRPGTTAYGVRSEIQVFCLAVVRERSRVTAEVSTRKSPAPGQLGPGEGSRLYRTRRPRHRSRRRAFVIRAHRTHRCRTRGFRSDASLP